MERILQQVIWVHVISREEIPPEKIFNLDLISFDHIHLVEQTEGVLGQNEQWGEEDQHPSSLTVKSFVSSVEDKENHVTKIVEAVKVLNTSLEKVNQDYNMNETAWIEYPNPFQLFAMNSFFEEPDQSIFNVRVVKSPHVTTNHHWKHKQNQNHKHLLKNWNLHFQIEVFTVVSEECGVAYFRNSTHVNEDEFPSQERNHDNNT